MFKFNKVQFNITFFLLLFVSILFDCFFEFVITLFMITLHELSHVLLAKFFKLKIGDLTITGIGEKVNVYNINSLCKYKRILIYLVGPLTNLIIAIVCYYLKLFNIMHINLVIFIFNLLPIYPLDGGKIFLEILITPFGNLVANKIICKVSLFLGISIFILGFLQILLFSYNISLLLIGLYIIKINKSEYFNLTFEFYKNIFKKYDDEAKNFIHIKEILVSGKTSLKDVFYKMNFDEFIVFNVINNKSELLNFNERQFLDYVQVYGISGKVNDLIFKK